MRIQLLRSFVALTLLFVTSMSSASPFGLSTVAAVVSTSSAKTSSASPKTFVFSAIPDQDEANLQERFDKVAVYLQAQLGIEVRYIPVKSYSAAVTAFRNNQVQLAWFGGLSGVQARRLVPDSQAIAQGTEDPFFTSYIIAHSSTGIEPSDSLPAAITGKSFTFGSKGSTSGRLMPEHFIRKNLGDTPNNLFSKVGYSGDHSRTIALVQSGAYEVGAVNYKVWDKQLAAGKIDSDKVKVIWRTPSYPDYQWTVRGDVNDSWGPGFQARLTEALLGMNDPDLLASFPRSGFIAADNELYQPILDTAISVGIIDAGK
ncbi:putative selenate ABC transporter substrate-binding protein [Porticoccaceae bacterium]|nr:putative selenate ABC transporter substrate-binding protein [Porticoccaceae bacterium]MDB9949375.1 putative selenate ABC transporter substrate-binding protein [Porticoccaceae bacterium]